MIRSISFCTSGWYDSRLFGGVCDRMHQSLTAKASVTLHRSDSFQITRCVEYRVQVWYDTQKLYLKSFVFTYLVTSISKIENVCTSEPSGHGCELLIAKMMDVLARYHKVCSEHKQACSLMKVTYSQSESELTGKDAPLKLLLIFQCQPTQSINAMKYWSVRTKSVM